MVVHFDNLTKTIHDSMPFPVAVITVLHCGFGQLDFKKPSPTWPIVTMIKCFEVQEHLFPAALQPSLSNYGDHANLARTSCLLTQ